MKISRPHVVIIGGGFLGLSAALELCKLNIAVTVLEQNDTLGGLAGSFNLGDFKLEKFYHHWFINDDYIMNLIAELGLKENIRLRSTHTGMYYANQFYRLSSPTDVLKFKPLALLDRLRLGLFVLRARKIRHWQKLESYSAKEWLLQLCGSKIYKIVWEPLLIGKFGPHAETISASWFWKKIILRGGSRSKYGNENLAYFQGGFSALIDAMTNKIISQGGIIKTNAQVQSLVVKDKLQGVQTNNEFITADAVIATPALPIIADIAEPHLPAEFINNLRRIKYLANVCLVLELDRSLSNTYWLNVNDVTFPFVGIIEHTNFEPGDSYGGRHLVYLSKYLASNDAVFNMTATELLQFAIPHLKRMFPHFSDDWIKNFYVWHADYAQPITTKNYHVLIPAQQTPLNNFFIATMAQIYPEDRGTNYAIREGQRIAKRVAEIL